MDLCEAINYGGDFTARRKSLLHPFIEFGFFYNFLDLLNYFGCWVTTLLFVTPTRGELLNHLSIIIYFVHEN
jgi:hypothetical protein